MTGTFSTTTSTQHSCSSTGRMNMAMSFSSRRLISSVFIVGLLLALNVKGWESGIEYSYEYEGRLAVTGPSDGGAAIIIQLGQLTVQSVDDSTLLLKLSEVRIGRLQRDGNYTLGGTPDQITLPAGATEEGEEAVGDSLHLLTPFVLVHNKGSMVSLMVETDEPQWSVNVKKAIASLIQLDIAGVRSSASETAVFGERDSLLETYEDGVTGDCSTTLQTTRLPFSRVVQHQDICRRAGGNNVYEILKMRDFSRCRNSRSPVHSFIQRSAVYKYLMCGESAERATILRVDGRGDASNTGATLWPSVITSAAMTKTEQLVHLVLTSRQQIHQLLPPLMRPRIIDSLTFAEDEDPPVSAAEFENLRKDLLELNGGVSDPEKFKRVGHMLSRFNSTQLRQMWTHFNGRNDDSRDLFIDCVATSNGDSLPAVSFILDLIVQGELQSGRALWALLSAGLSVRSPSLPLLQRFVDVIQPGLSKAVRMSALAVAAELLHSACVRFKVICHPDARIITDDFLPLAVKELANKAHSAADRVAVLTALGILGTDDVLLLLVPYIRGEDSTAERIAAVLALDRLMNMSPDRVTPILASLADNVAEEPEVRMAAIRVLLFSNNVPISVWKRTAFRTWFEPNRQVHAFVYGLIRSLSTVSEKARMVVDMARPTSFSPNLFHSGMGFLSHGSIWRVPHSSLSPAFIGYQLHFYDDHSGRFDPVQVSIWNYQTEDFWSRLLGFGAARQNGKSPRSINLLDEFWYQQASSLPQRGDQRRHLTVELLHLKVLGAHLFLRPEDLLLAGRSLNKWKGRITKFLQPVDLRATLASELGFPVHFRASFSLLASVQGLLRSTSEVNVTATLSGKWTGEVRAELPFNGHEVAAGVNIRTQLHAPLSFNTSKMSLTWYPPEESTELFDHQVEPYINKAHTVTGGSSKKPSVARLGPNLRLEMTGEGFQLMNNKAGRLRIVYIPEEIPLKSVSLNTSIMVAENHQDTIDFFSGLNDTLDDAAGSNCSVDEQVGFRVSIQASYRNGSSAEWHRLQVDRNYNSDDRFLQPVKPFFFPQVMTCSVGLEKIRTFDGVDYDYALNGCQHLLVAESEKYAITASRTSEELRNMTVRITLERDVVDIESSGEVSVNGITEDAQRIRLHDGDRFLLVVERLGNHTVLVRLPEAGMDLLVQNQSAHLSSARLRGQVRGLCGDGDGEATGEFKTAARCALSSGALMAFSYQMNTGLNDCPALLPGDVSEMLQTETYPCFPADELVISALPLPPES